MWPVTNILFAPVADDILLRLHCPLGFWFLQGRKRTERVPRPCSSCRRRDEGEHKLPRTRACSPMSDCPTCARSCRHVQGCDVWQLRGIGRWRHTVAYVSKTTRQRVGRDWPSSAPCARRSLLPRVSSECCCVILTFTRDSLLQTPAALEQL